MGGPVGPVTSPRGQYTHCVDRKDYQGNPESLGFFDIGVPSQLAAACEYLLGGKLVCLAGGGDECVIGTVVGIEEVGYEKPFPKDIDNDFSFNVLVIPFRPQDFAAYLSGPPAAGAPPAWEPHGIKADVGKTPLGFLLDDPTPSPTPLPEPSEPAGGRRLDGYGVGYRWHAGTLVYDHAEQDNLNKLADTTTVWTTAGPPNGLMVAVPIVHCECEGSRIWFVCQAMKPFLDLLQLKPPGGLPSPGEACRAVAKWMPWPLNKLVKAVCALVEDAIALPIALAIAPAVAAAFAAAWEAAQAYDDAFVTGPVSRQITMGEPVIVSGRWVWDGGHAGHTELHPVKTFQRVVLPPGFDGGHDPRQALPPDVEAAVRDFHDRWCRLVRQAPPFDPFDPAGLLGSVLDTLTPEQRDVLDRQRRPQNGWELHPAVDGCVPDREPPPIR